MSNSTLLLIVLAQIAWVVVFLYAANKFMQKKLNINEIDDALLYGFVNESHKKIDRTALIISLILVLIVGASGSRWFPLPIAAWVFISQILRAVMQYKYSKVPNAYKLTISNTIFIIVALVVAIFIVYFINPEMF